MAVTPMDLRCERAVAPIGVGTATPRLSWRLAHQGETEVVQVAAQVVVTGAGGDPVWDSGRVEGWRQQLRYGGPPPASRQACRWTVRVWTTSAAAAEPVESLSEPATFELGLLAPEDWSARMVRPDGELDGDVARLATRFEIPDVGVVRARLHLSGHGLVAAAIDGVEVGDEVLAPGWTSYHHRLAVRTHDVTAAVGRGTHELAVVVAPGWFSGRLGFAGGRALYGDHLGVLAQLEVDLADGRRLTIATDEERWSATATPWLAADLYDGETYDARRADPTDALGGAVRAAVPVTAVELDPSVLVAPAAPPVRRTQVVPTSSVQRLTDGTVAVDVGQNVVGWLRVRLRGMAAGDEVVLRHAEVLDADGRLCTAPLRTARATDTYVVRGGGEEELYEPRFSFHGFRFAEIAGVPEHAEVDVEAVVVHTDMAPAGTFACSDADIVRLHENVVWGWHGNAVGVPTDCPQRDERLGWTGDIAVFAPTAAHLDDVETFLEGWLADLRADQRDDGAVPNVVPDIGLGLIGQAGWGDAAVTVPWALYEAYGDEAVLADALASMVAWVDYVWSRLDDDGVWSGDFQFGDWLDPDAPTGEPWRAKARFALVATACAVHVAELTGRAASVVGASEMAASMAERAADARARWWARFADEAATTQTGCAMALAFDLAPADERLGLGDRLAELVRDADDHLATGFLGTPLLLPALTDAGHHDVAGAVLAQRSAPSWLYQVAAGATTIWERWDALRPDGSIPLDGLGGGEGSMVSFNHYAYGAVAEWLHRRVLGIAPDLEDPGYHHVVVAPRPPAWLTWARGTQATRFGTVTIEWRRTDDGTLALEVEVPPNASATIDPGDGRDTIEVGSGWWSLP